MKDCKRLLDCYVNGLGVNRSGAVFLAAQQSRRQRQVQAVLVMYSRDAVRNYGDQRCNMCNCLVERLLTMVLFK